MGLSVAITMTTSTTQRLPAAWNDETTKEQTADQRRSPDVVLECTDSIFPSSSCLKSMFKSSAALTRGGGGGADLIVCNPPWIPPDDTMESLMDSAIFDSHHLLPRFFGPGPTLPQTIQTQ